MGGPRDCHHCLDRSQARASEGSKGTSLGSLSRGAAAGRLLCIEDFCPLQKALLKLHLQCNGWEESPRGLMLLQKGFREGVHLLPFCLLPCEHTASLPSRRLSIPGTILEAETGPSPDTKPSKGLNFAFPCLQNLETNICSLKTTLSQVLCLVAQIRNAGGQRPRWLEVTVQSILESAGGGEKHMYVQEYRDPRDQQRSLQSSEC
jgi:hypothetical protein